jgi:hypothetical protein
MTKLFSRSPGDMFLGLVAVAPAIAIPLLFLAWVHRINSFTSDIASLDMSYNPLSTWMVGGMLAVCALYLIALIAVIRDIWVRPLAQDLRIMWTILTLLFAPYAGVVYWVVECRSEPPLQVA